MAFKSKTFSQYNFNSSTILILIHGIIAILKRIG